MGYELARSLDFDSTASYGNGVNQEWRTGNGWTPILNFQATLDGRGNTISNLYHNSQYEGGGLFYSYGGGLFYNLIDAVVTGVGLVEVDITGDYELAALAGENRGTISHCYATGSITSHSRDSSGDIGGAGRQQ